MGKIFTLIVVVTTNLFAGDDPFFRFNCRFKRAFFDKEFLLQFHGDSSAETVEWVSDLKGTKVTFQKVDKKSVHITVITGPLVIAQATPAEYMFISPLTVPSFHFITGLSPMTLESQVFSLNCSKTADSQ